jgi:hypothetical protein
MNGTMGKITRVNGNGDLTVAVGEGKKARNVTFNLNKRGKSVPKYNYIDHSYAVTVYKSQGMTVDRCIVHHDAEDGMASQNSIYVGITRAKEGTQIFSSNFNKSGFNLMKQAGEKDMKTSTLDEYDKTRIGRNTVDVELAKYRPVEFKMERDLVKEQKQDERGRASEDKKIDKGKDFDIEFER